jgi:hypothetical protein
MAAYPGYSVSAQSRYYEAVHQELAPLARDLERDLAACQERVKALEDALRPIVMNVDTYTGCRDEMRVGLALDIQVGDLRRAAALLEKS